MHNQRTKQPNSGAADQTWMWINPIKKAAWRNKTTTDTPVQLQGGYIGYYGAHRTMRQQCPPHRHRGAKGRVGALLREGYGRDVYPRLHVNGRAVFVVCALCACVLLPSRTSAHSHLAGIALPTPLPSHKGSRRPSAPCVPRCTMSAFCVVSHCLLLSTTLHCTVCALLHCSCG